MKGSGRGRTGGARFRGAALSSLFLPPIEGPSLRGFGRGRPVRLQDPSGASADPGRGGGRPPGGRGRARAEGAGCSGAGGGGVAPGGNLVGKGAGRAARSEVRKPFSGESSGWGRGAAAATGNWGGGLWKWLPWQDGIGWVGEGLG